MKRVLVEGVRSEDVAHAVGEETFARGREYARRGAVRHAAWVDEECVVEALVSGSGRSTYATAVYFEPDGLGTLELVHGECSCPMGVMCKHVAAVALAVAPDGDRPGREVAAVPASWEGALEALLPGDGAAARTAAPLAIELSPADDATGRLTARLLRPGKRGWIAGGLTWNRLDELRHGHELRSDHVALARELLALHQAGGAGSRPSYYPWSYGEQKTIDLSGLASRRFWPWLDEAVAAGLALLGPGHRPVPGHRRGAMVLDVTGGAGGPLSVAPVLVVDGQEHPEADVRAVAFVGDHGVLHAPVDGEGGAATALSLTRLDPPVAPEVARAALRGAVVAVPADQVEASDRVSGHGWARPSPPTAASPRRSCPPRRRSCA